MKIGEAIETLKLENKHPWNRGNSELREAVKLGVEALKKIRECQKHNCTLSNLTLPGETEE